MSEKGYFSTGLGGVAGGIVLTVVSVVHGQGKRDPGVFRLKYETLSADIADNVSPSYLPEGYDLQSGP